MKSQEPTITRREAFVLGTHLLIGSAVVSLVVAPRRAEAGKASKADFLYQEKPKDGKSCATCRLYVAGEAGKGSCAVVDGDVSANGWCMAYSPRT